MSDRERDADSRGGGDRADDFFRALSIPLLAHELKGPLAVIEAGVSTALERAAEGGADAAKLVRTLRRVLRSTCFSVEPGIYLREFGVRSEVNVFIDAAGAVHVTGGELQTRVVPILDVV